MTLRTRLVLAALALSATCLIVIADILLVRSPDLWTRASGSHVGKTITAGPAAIGGPFALESTRGETVTDRTYRGKWLVIFFDYTSCPDVCPTALNNMSLALDRLGRDADKLQPLFVTVDPQRDTRDVMVDYLGSFDQRIIGLTGTASQIEVATKEYRVYVASEKSASNGDNYLVSHSSYIYLMDPRGRFVDVIEGSEPGEDIAVWLRKETAD